MQKVIFHADCDSFYASVEIAANSKLKGKPVVVGHDPKAGKGRGIVLAASYEARKYGIRTAMPVSRAYRLCPHAVFLPGNRQLYGEVSNRIMTILEGVADKKAKFRRASIDEAYLEVTEHCTNFPHPVEYAKLIREKIRQQERIKISIGVAESMVLAKIASKCAKPDGITFVDPDKTHQFLAPLPVSTIPGIGNATKIKLNKNAIHTIGDLQSVSIKTLRKIFGISGAEWVRKRARGIDGRDVAQRKRIRKSISKNKTFFEDLEPTDPRITETFDKITQRISEKLMKKKGSYRTVTIKVRFEDFETISRSKSFPSQIDSFESIRETVDQLFLEFIDSHKRIRLIGIQISNLRFNKKPTTLGDYFQDKTIGINEVCLKRATSHP